jgi:hypothetical protein
MPATPCEYCGQLVEPDGPDVIQVDGLSRHYRPWYYCDQECADADKDEAAERESTNNRLRRL